MIAESKDKQKIYEHLNKNRDCVYVNDIYISILNNNTQGTVLSRLAYTRIYTTFLLSIGLSGILIFLNLLFRVKIVKDKELAIARVKREKTKIINVNKDVQFIEDDIKNYDFSIYRIGTRLNRLSFAFRSFISQCSEDFGRIRVLLNYEPLLPFAMEVLGACAKRIPHTVMFKWSIEHVINSYTLPTVYIGATHERFALICEEICCRYGKRLVCIPHGVETTEKMPAGYVGDVFFCSSVEMAAKLNELYESSKFIYDENTIRQMYSVKKISSNSNLERRNIVFFTQPIYTDSSKKLIEKIASFLSSRGIKLHLKIHPLEKQSDYVIENSEIIPDFETAITGNICISLSSTALLESLYNNSVAISIVCIIDNELELTRNYDFLNDNRIEKPEHESTLFELLGKYCS